jgi:outer membrane lipoprotein LolB
MLCRTMHGKKLVFSFFLVLLLGMQLSCSTLTKTTIQAPVNWQETLQNKEQILSWKIQGKLGVQTEDNGGSLDLFWNQQGDDYQIRVIAPMGQGAVLIRGDSRGVYVKTADGKEQYSDDANALLASELGVSLPLAGLRDWIRGMPAKGQVVASQEWNEKGQLVKLVQNNWHIEMSAYREVAGHILPNSFHFGRDDRPELSIRLLVRQWKLTQGKWI